MTKQQKTKTFDHEFKTSAMKVSADGKTVRMDNGATYKRTVLPSPRLLKREEEPPDLEELLNERTSTVLETSETEGI